MTAQRTRVAVALSAISLTLAAAAASPSGARGPMPQTGPLPPAARPAPLPATVTIDLRSPLTSFRPDQALGAGLDGHSQGDTAQIYTPANVRAMQSAGLGPLTYRLRTELGVEAWHPAAGGRFSDAAHRQGYWTPGTHPRGHPTVSWGYGLPRRGNSVDQANDTGYSRIDDGDPHSFWKSNPYLDSHYTHEPDSRHPQWVLIDLHRARPVDGIAIRWAAPYARAFSVQHWVGPSAVLQAGHPLGHWKSFPGARFAGRGGTQTLRLSRRPLGVRFVRVLMTRSSHTAPRGSRDARDALGYAVNELRLGTLAGGRLRDLLRHSRSGARQTTIYTSSTDPWHRASDRDPGYEQPSFQTILRSGLSHGLPLLVPVPVLYGTPAAAVAELRYLRALGVPLRGVELGEEPDGQLASPEDYGALYVQFARAIHRAFPGLPVGGPGFQTSIPDWLAWPNRGGDRSWTHRFLGYLAGHGGLAQLGFFSFEWYPFDNVCAAPGPQLAGASRTLAAVLAGQRAHGLPAGVPVYVTEYGYSAFAGQSEVDLPGGLLAADTVGTLLGNGGSAAYLYGYEPDTLIRESSQCSTWGNLTLNLTDGNRQIRYALPSLYANRLMTQAWTQPGDQPHTLYRAASSAVDGAGRELVRAYPVRRPDGRLAVMLLNLSPSQPYVVRLETLTGAGRGALTDPLEQWQYSSDQFVWHPRGDHGFARPDAPPAHTATAGGSIRLPPFSLTVVSSGD